MALGKKARSAVPRSSQGAWEAKKGRPDPVALLESQAASRVPDLVPIRYGRMLVSPFTFYRGAALVMASDLATTPRSGLNVQACGDAHMSNFGVFASAERNLVFDVNDFDETLPGPWEWDVKRLAASLTIAGRERGFSDKERADVVLESAGAYRRIREANALVIAFFVETFGGLRAVQAFRREERNEEIFGRLSADYASATRRSSQLSAVFAPGKRCECTSPV